MAGEDIQALDHAEGVERGPGRLGADIGHAEDLAALQFFLQVGDDIQQLGVGIQQVFEAGIAEAKGRGDVVPGGLAPSACELAINFPEEVEGLHRSRSSLLSIKNYTRFGPGRQQEGRGREPQAPLVFKRHIPPPGQENTAQISRRPQSPFTICKKC